MARWFYLEMVENGIGFLAGIKAIDPWDMMDAVAELYPNAEILSWEMDEGFPQ